MSSVGLTPRQTTSTLNGENSLSVMSVLIEFRNMNFIFRFSEANTECAIKDSTVRLNVRLKEGLLMAQAIFEF